jgi:hypothetical protein
MNKIKVSHECPLEVMEISRVFNDYDYLLPHLLDKHPQYLSYFLKSKELNRYIVMDNSLHELGQAYDTERLLYWINVLKPNEFIVPDVWEDKNKTVRNAKEWANIDLPSSVTKVAVAQGKSITDLATCIETFKTLGYEKYALSYGADFYNHVGTYHPNIYISKMFGRIHTVYTLQQMGVICNTDRVHLLGCYLPQEFIHYKGMPFLESIDTSNPIMAALDNIDYEDFGLDEKPGLKIDEVMALPKDQINYYKIISNTDKFRTINHL